MPATCCSSLHLIEAFIKSKKQKGKKINMKGRKTIVFQILTYDPDGAESSIPMGPTLPTFVKAFYMPFTYVHQVLTG